MKKEKEYVPFGEEWKNELMQLSKIHIISLYRMVCMERDELYYSINLPNKSEEEKQETLNKIGELLEKDIPEQKFILALLQIKKYVQPFYKDSTGI